MIEVSSPVVPSWQVTRTHQNLAQLVIGNVVQFSSMVLRDNELANSMSVFQTYTVESSVTKAALMVLTAWPLLRGPMSRKARVLSLSKSLNEGISPVWYVSYCQRSDRPTKFDIPLIIRQKMQDMMKVLNWPRLLTRTYGVGVI